MERPDTQYNVTSWDWLDGLGSVWRARYLVAAAVLLSGLITAAVVLMVPRDYQAVAALRVGKVMDRMLADPVHVASAVNSESIGSRLRQAGVTGRTAEEFADAVSATLDMTMVGPATVTSPVLSIEARGPSPEAAKQLALAVAKVIIAEHQPRYNDSVKRLEEFREALQGQVAAVRGEIAEIDTALRSFRSTPTISAPAILLMRAQLEEKQTQLLGFVREQRDLDLNMTVNTEMTAVVAEPTVPRARIRPRRTITTIAGAATGGLLAVFWAIALDARRRHGHTARVAEPR